MPIHDDFYVGYRDSMPASTASWLRARLLPIAGVLLLLALALTLLPVHFNSGRFEFGQVREYTGVVRLDPVPIAMAEAVGDSPAGSARYSLLVAEGKYGARALFEGREGQLLSFRATRIERDGQPMLEVVAGSISRLEMDPSVAIAEAEALGDYTFRGEIVDSKCYLGVMSPGNLKTHKACAIRCLAGGIPPVLLVRDRQDGVLYLVLCGPKGEALNEELLDKVAVPVEIHGQVLRRGNLHYLVCAPEAIRVL